MENLTGVSNELTTISAKNPNKIETWAGKRTARVTKVFYLPDGSTVKATKKINIDGSITEKIERRKK